jgi:hypothetical protein
MAATLTPKAKNKTLPLVGPPQALFHPIKWDDVEVGHVMAVLHFVTVTQVQKNGRDPILIVEDVSKNNSIGEFRIEGKKLIEKCLSADLYAEEVFVSQTEVIKKLMASQNRPLTVKWTKKNGEDRTLRGRYVGEEALRGYSWCIDLDEGGDAMKQVDHRTLQFLIVDGVKFTVK